MTTIAIAFAVIAISLGLALGDLAWTRQREERKPTRVKEIRR